MKIEGKSGQLTVFVIVGIIIVVSVVGLFFLSKKADLTLDPKKDPQGFVEQCVGDTLKESEERLLPQAGYRNFDKYILYENKKVAYLCYTAEEKELCTNLKPLLADHIEQELQKDSLARVEDCFAQLKNSFSGYSYSASPTDYSIEVVPNKLTATVNKKITITRGESVLTFDKFVYEEASPVFDFIAFTNQILFKETTCDCGKETCNVDVFNMYRMNPIYELGLFVTSNNEKVYSVKDTITGKEFKFAVRNCIRLP